MDYNRNDQNNQWDRWNSNASHSSYYNQPTHRPYGQAFIIASLVCGLLSITIGFCGIALPLGALGILFAMLVYRKGKRLDNTCKAGLILSSLGCGMGILLIIYIRILTPLLLQQELRNPAARQQMEYVYDALFQNSTGIDFQEYIQYLEDLYGFSLEE